MIGGFLGAGKSSAVLALAEHLRDRGQTVGLITNDQSVGLVDTALMKSHGFAVEEIPGGCFCCRFDSLVAASRNLEAAAAPDVFIAEPVGSCTDLVATVSYPLQRIYGDQYTIAPLSVMVDPIRAMRILGLAAGRSFSPKVVYVYRKQLEEADLIVINKIDLLTAGELEALRGRIEAEFPQAQVLCVSIRSGGGLPDWFDRITSQTIGSRATMDIDYDTYAEGEALMGWLNATIRLEAPRAFDGELIMMSLAARIRDGVAKLGGEIAHLKMTMLPDDHGGAAATLNMVRNDYVPELSQSLAEKMRRGELLVNLRAEADPADLESIVRQALPASAPTGVSASVEHLAQFRPGRPQPKWRMTDAQTLSPFST